MQNTGLCGAHNFRFILNSNIVAYTSVSIYLVLAALYIYKVRARKAVIGLIYIKCEHSWTGTKFCLPDAT